MCTGTIKHPHAHALSLQAVNLTSSYIYTSTGNSVKVHIELCEGGTADPVNAMGMVNGSSCHGETLRTYCSERENQMLSPNWQQQTNHLIH